ncbi:MAG: peptidase M48 [Sulfurovum sp. AS07-7]|nr:MAG: peptidase M48 [Sulfurovum sp. AS07-7]
MLEIIVIAYTFYTLLKVYISVMQIGFVSNEITKEPVLMDKEKFVQAGKYTISKERSSIVGNLVDYLFFIAWISFGFKMLLDGFGIDNSILSSLLFLFGFITVNWIVGLPFEIYQAFKLDKDYGFSEMTPKLFILDQLKSIAIFLILGVGLFSLFIWIISSFENWWLWSFVLMMSIIFLANVIYPTVIAPLFNKFSPLEDGELKNKIESLMSGVGLESNGIFTMDASKRDNRLNAYFAGMGKSKRVVLFDTLIKKLSSDELLAVLGHELGHFLHGDIWKNMAMIAVLLFGAFFIIGNLPESLYFEMGLEAHAGVKIAIMMMIFPLISFFFLPIMSLMSRHNEYEADKYASSQSTGASNLVNALIKLVGENKSFPKSHPLVIFFFYSHPPILERLKALGYEDKLLEKEGIFSYL